MNTQLIAVKVGTSTLIRENGKLNLSNMDRLARALCDLSNMGHRVVLVSSGAIGIGTGKLNLPGRPTELREKQAAAAVGQCEMMHLYDKFFGEYGHTVAQILLTAADVADPVRSAHLSATFSALFELGCIPIVNENDAVDPTEIETGSAKVLGDNDTLSAIVAKLCGADLLVLLSDIDGLFDKDPHKHSDARLIHTVPALTKEVLALAGTPGSRWGTGGMSTKLSAAGVATAAGIDMVITHGAHPERLPDIVAGAAVGTRFLAQKEGKA
ncbi:MAG: glutamate 5-kinase [Oscillospiraceae bacterium]